MWREKLSGGRQRREEEEERARRSKGPDREVQGCRSWAEYRRLMEGRRKGNRRRDMRPAHLWEKDVTPLHDPRQGTSTGENSYSLTHSLNHSCHLALLTAPPTIETPEDTKLQIAIKMRSWD